MEGVGLVALGVVEAGNTVPRLSGEDGDGEK